MHLTVLQTYKFYGRMLNMKEDQIVERTKALATLLDISFDNQTIDTLR